MAERHLPTVPVPAPGTAAGPHGVAAPGGPGDGGGDRAKGDAPASGWRGSRSRVGLVLAGAAALSGGLILSLGLASLVGDAVRDAVLVEVDRSPVGSEPSYSDAPAEAAAFFAVRDTVSVRVARDMTVGEFLSLYHLETNTAARAALRDQLGAVEDGDVLREGDRVVLTITVPRVRP